MKSSLAEGLLRKRLRFLFGKTITRPPLLGGSSLRSLSDYAHHRPRQPMSAPGDSLISVLAAVITHEGRYLICQRPLNRDAIVGDMIIPAIRRAGSP